ncbi:hypothetical protein [Nonomuraea sp. NPDC048901]|uniref:hypothetical protein n=1 Tax=Nonomuraea sp. NPDC048901 TaxID=3155627 RepID=UPI003407BC3E
MTPAEAGAYFDGPAHAQWACGLLLRARPGWEVSRGADRIWRARRGDWPPERPPLADTNVGLVNEAMYMDALEAA